MSEIPDDSKVIRLPVAVPPASEAQRRELLREEILELLDDATHPTTSQEPPPRAQEWIPAEPKPTEPPILPDAPSPYHRNAIECPQCDRWTWRGTDHCRWCGFSLSDYYALLEQEKLARREERMREYAIALRRRMLFWAFGLLVLGVTIASNSQVFPEPMRRYVVYVGFVVMVVGALVAYSIPK